MSSSSENAGIVQNGVRMKTEYRCPFLFSPVRIISICILMCVAACSGGATSPTSPNLSVPDATVAQIGNDSMTATRGALNVTRPAQGRLLPPPGTIYFGAYVNFQNNLGPYEAQTKQFEQQIGRTLGVHSEYYEWTDNFPGAPEEDDYARGRLPVISWDCGATDYSVAEGDQDAVIIQRAQAFKAYGRLIMVRFFWEMNLTYEQTNRAECYDPVHDEAGGVFSPTEYVAAWDHIRAVFAAQGVTNVVWLWNTSGSPKINPMPYYPGATETDWVGFDHYDLTGNAGLFNTLSAPYQVLEGLHQPIMVGETGTTLSAQSTYLKTAPSVLQSNFPAILGFIYYDAIGHRQDWRLTTAGIAAFKTAGATKYFSGMVKYNAK